MILQYCSVCGPGSDTTVVFCLWTGLRNYSSVSFVDGAAILV